MTKVNPSNGNKQNKTFSMGHIYSFVPSCRGGQIANFWEKNPQVHLIRWSNKWSNDLVVNALDTQSRDPLFKTTGWLQGRLSLSSF